MPQKKLEINIIAGPFLPIPPLKGGGIEVYLYNLALELSKRHKVRIYSRRHDGLKKHECNGNLEIVRIGGFAKGGNDLLNFIKEIIFAASIFFALRRADINHFFHAKSFILSLAGPRRGSRIVHLQIPFAGFTSNFLKFADLLVANSDFVRGHFKKITGVPDEKIISIPNGVDIERFRTAGDAASVRRRYDLSGKKVIGYVGRIAPEKGIEYLIEAFRLLREKRVDMRLLLIGPYLISEYGDPIYHSRLMTMIDNYGLKDDVSFTGLVQHEELPNYYAACDVTVFPSDWEEPFGIVCIEALASGKPVIVTESGAFKEIVRNGINGYIVPKRDPISIAEKLTLFFNNESLAAEFSRIASESAKAYSFTAIAERYEKIYELFDAKIEIERSSRKFYNTNREYFVYEKGLNESLSKEREEAFRFIPPGSLVLDVACGTAENGRYISKFATYVGVDFSDIAIEMARHNKSENFKIVKAVSSDLPFNDNTFDIVLATYALEHFLDPQYAIDEMYRVCKKGGMIIMLSPAWDLPFQFPPSMSIERNILKRLFYTIMRVTEDALEGIFGFKERFRIIKNPSFLKENYKQDNDVVYLIKVRDVVEYMEEKGCKVKYLSFHRDKRGNRMAQFLKGLLVRLPIYRFGNVMLFGVFQK